MLNLRPEKYIGDFPLAKNYTYLDNACVTLKPKQVIDKINEYYTIYPGCGGRSSHSIGRKVTEEVENSRRIIEKTFKEKVVFTRNTTEGINLIAKSYPFKKGDIVLLSNKEHNSNLVPWQELRKKGVKLDFYEHGDLNDFKEKVEKASFVATNQVSNLDGSIQEVEEMVRITRKYNIKILIDGAQALPHKQADVRLADYYVASGHKMLGPSGTGMLFAKEENLDLLENYNVGGDTVKDTTFKEAEFESGINRFEAGLQDYAGILGLGEAIKYLNNVGFKKIERHENKLRKLAVEELQKLGGKIFSGSGGIVSFNFEGIDPHDLALQLNERDVMVRSGYHCCHSWFNEKGIKGSVRASFYFYNTEEDVKRLVEAVKQAVNILK